MGLVYPVGRAVVKVGSVPAAGQASKAQQARAPQPGLSIEPPLPDAASVSHLIDVGGLSAGRVLGYQRLVGNRAVQRLVGNPRPPGPAVAQRDYVVSPYVRDLSTHFAEDQYSALRAAIADYQKLVPGASVKVRQGKLEKVVSAFTAVASRTVTKTIRARLDTLGLEIDQEQARLSGTPAAAASPTETPVTTEPTPRRAPPSELPRVESRSVASARVESRPVASARVESRPVEPPRVESRPVALPRVESRPVELPRVRPEGRATLKAETPPATPPETPAPATDERTQAVTRRLGEWFEQAEATNAKLDDVIALHGKLRSARAREDWAELVSAEFARQFDPRLRTIVEKVRSKNDFMDTLKGGLKEAESPTTPAERIDKLRTGLQRLRGQSDWQTKVTAAFTREFDTRLAVIRVAPKPAAEAATPAVTRGAAAKPASATARPKVSEPEETTTTEVPATVRAPAHRPPPAEAPWTKNPISYLTRELGVIIVPAGDRSVGPEVPKDWKTDELAVVARVFSMLGDDKKALRGVGLVRVKTVTAVRASGDWVTEALFSHQYKIDSAAGNNLKVSDAIFEKLTAAKGEAAEGELSVAHEGAHAIETFTAREKSWAWEAARVRYNTAATDYDRAYAKYIELFEASATGTGPEIAAASTAEELADGAKTSARAEHDRAERDYYAVFSKTRNQSHRLLNFIQLVNSESISPGLTAYAADTWPHNPREFYAEAYAYFVLNPERLKKHSLALHQFFAGRGYLNDARPG
jgi:hypothetical protein